MMRHRNSPHKNSLVLPERMYLKSDNDDGDDKKAKQRRKRLLHLLFGSGILAFVGTLLYMSHYDAPRLGNQKRYVAQFQGTVGENCRYDGHCPMGSTCAVSSAADQVGFCEPIITTKSAKAAAEACFLACQSELELDEHFYQEEWPVIVMKDTVASAGRPAGCALEYYREPEGHRWKDREQQKPPLLDEWMAQRFRYVIRVDPRDPHNAADKTWISYCFNPCQTNADCATENDASVPGFVCQDGACQRNPVYWESDEEPVTVIVTGATKSYFHGLKNLVASAQYWAPKTPVVVYNLGGLDQSDQKAILSWKNVISMEWPVGVPQHYPEHVHQGRIYAWKPIIINETLIKYKSIFWLDAGSTLTGPITPAEKIIHRTGMFLVKGQDLSMQKQSFPKTYEWFNTTKGKLQTGPHFSGNTQAHLYPSRYYDAVVLPNAECALDVNCIAPPGSSLEVHRYDQTTLSIVAYHPKVRAPHYTEYLAAYHNQLSSDLRKPSSKFVWTARQSCSFYAELMGL